MTAQQLDNLIYQQAKKRGASDALARLVVQMARHETGNYSSKVFLENNNAFGYKYVKGAKWQSGAGRMSPEGNNYARYRSVNDSVNEVMDWMARREKQGLFKMNSLTDSTAFANALKSGNYYGAPVSQYKRGLDAADDKIVIAAAGGLAGLLVVAGLIVLYNRK